MALAEAFAIPLDAPAAHWAHALPAAVTDVFDKITRAGLGGTWFALAGLGILCGILAPRASARRRAAFTETGRRGWYLLASVGLSGLAVQAVKHLVGRERPWAALDVGPHVFAPLNFDGKYASFPSGHTTTAFAVAASIGLMAPRLRPWLAAGAIVVGASRVIVLAHWPSDVVAGAFLGAGTAYALAFVFARRGLVFVREGTTLAPAAPGIVARALRATPAA
ncbi:MAG: phosphatase PAP2 family protein [Hyphomicrobiales bacterium]|nr:phosphatase PAP2 family protein [Hyphomicrobiales bacterium]